LEITEIKEPFPGKPATSELNIISILTRIAKAITETEDIVRIFQIATQKIRHYCFCDSIVILYNNPASNSFYLSPALNRNPLTYQPESSIPHNETLLRQLLSDNMTINCADFSTYDSLLPGDKQLFPATGGSFLAVPIRVNNSLLGIILLTNARKDAFDERDQALVEDVAVLMGLAMDRANLKRHAEHYQRYENRWHHLYAYLLKNVVEPIALISLRDDLIYQTNPAFETLCEFSAETLQGMKLSQLHSISPMNELQPVNHEEHHFLMNKVPLRTASGKKILIQLHLFKIGDEEQDLLLALYKSAHQPGLPFPGDNSHSELFSPELTQWIQEQPPENDPQQNLERILQKIGEINQVKYLTLHRIHTPDNEPELLAAHRFPKSTQQSYDQPWIISIGENPFIEIIEKQQYLIIEDIHQNQEFEQWRPIAQKLGYVALAAFPLLINDRMTGMLTFFFEQPRVFDELMQHSFQNTAFILAQFLENNHLKQQTTRLTGEIEVMNHIANSINSSLELEEVIRSTITELRRILVFDHACVTLFDEAGENIQVFTVVSKTLGEQLPQGNWVPLENTELGWLQSKNNSTMKTTFAKALSEIEKRLFSKINLLLLARGKYLGTFSVSSLHPHQYTADHQKFLKQIATQIAIAIENARLFETTNRNLTELAALTDISKTISTSLDLDQVFHQIVKAAAIALKAKICAIQRVEAGKQLDRVTTNLPDFSEAFMNQAFEKYLTTAIKELKPVFLEDISQTLPTASISENNLFNQLHSFLTMPVIAQEQAIALISLFWSDRRHIGDRESKLISMIAHQAASAIQNARLYQETIENSEQLKAANEELENFVYTVSHDLKSPIVSIQGFSSILLQEHPANLNQEAIHFLERIQANANQMEKLIRDLLELSRIGRVVNPFESVQAAQIINETLAELIYQIQEKKIEIIVQEHLPEIYCDRNRMRQVFTNLLSNAVKYIGNPAQPTIEIGCQEKNDAYLFFVKDNGIGIEPEYFEKIFGLFQILNPEQNQETSGTGVGLTIVKRIIENHGGKIWVESQKGAGATFYFTILKTKTNM